MMQDPVKQWECRTGVKFLQGIGVRPGDNLVDFGCRVGHYSIPAAFAVGHSGTVYAMDQDQRPLDELMEKARACGLENIKTIKTSGRPDLDMESRSIDVVLLYDVLHYFVQSQRQALLREVFRVLRPTGLLSVYPKHTLEDWPSKELKDLHVSDVVREICACGFRADGSYDGVISHDDALISGRVMNFRKAMDHPWRGANMFLLDRLKGHKSVGSTESEGLGPVLETVEQFKDRTFKVRARGIRASHVPVEEVRRFLQEELPGYYTYTAKTLVYKDRRQVRQARVEIKGWIGLSRRMNRYNPLDFTCTVCTESPASA